MSVPAEDGHEAAAGRRAWARSRGFRVGALALVVAAVWVGLLADPVVGPTILSMVGVFAAVLAIAALAAGLGWLGFGLFALGDRVAAWVRRSSRWPES